ncbi:MAG: hypothetical protein SFY66_22100 [Oculatellaceae cyanobacterium bins.114]|nr:hypothetical protein [Oculatellaceae cyanobacterium bins.114]
MLNSENWHAIADEPRTLVVMIKQGFLWQCLWVLLTGWERV